VSGSDPVRSLGGRLWSWALSALGLVIVASWIWSLLRPLLPVLVVVAVAVFAAMAWNQRRWR
jgi:hypothetical protein